MLAKGWANAKSSVAGIRELPDLDPRQFNRGELVDGRGSKEPMPVSGNKSYNDSTLKTAPFADQWGYRVASITSDYIANTYDANSLNKNELKPPLSSSYNSLMQIEPRSHEPTNRHSLMTLMAKIRGGDDSEEILKALKSLPQRKAEYVAEHARSSDKRAKWRSITADIQRLEIERDTFRKARIIADIVRKSDGLISGINADDDLIFNNMFGDFDGFYEEEILEVKEENADKSISIKNTPEAVLHPPLTPSQPDEFLPKPVSLPFTNVPSRKFYKKQIFNQLTKMINGVEKKDINAFIKDISNKIVDGASKKQIVNLVSDAIEEVKAPGIEDADVENLVDNIIDNKEGIFGSADIQYLPSSESEEEGEAPELRVVSSEEDEKEPDIIESIPSDWVFNDKQAAWKGVPKGKNMPPPEVQSIIDITRKTKKHYVNNDKLATIAKNLGIDLKIKSAKKRGDAVDDIRSASIRKIFGSNNTLVPIIYKYWDHIAQAPHKKTNQILDIMQSVQAHSKESPAMPSSAMPSSPSLKVTVGEGYQIGSGISKPRRNFNKAWSSTKSKNTSNFGRFI
jgi:hypothetical protein